MNMFTKAVLALTFMMCACTDPNASEIKSVPAEDAEMNEAKAEARETLGTFVEGFEGGASDGLLKVYFSEKEAPTDGEHMWVKPTSLSGTEFEGVLLSTPGKIKGLKGGQEVTFTREDVTDWLLVRDGKAVGAYTVRLLRERMSPKERQEHDSHYPFSFE